MRQFRLYNGNSLEVLKKLGSRIARTAITSPPYFGLRDYCEDGGEIGYQQTLPEYIQSIVEVARELRRVLTDDGTLWLEAGVTYAGSGGAGGDYGSGGTREGQRKYPRQPRPDGYKPKDMIPVPWLLADALRADGYFLRQEIIWVKGISFKRGEGGWTGSVMPSSCKDRFALSHETIFLLSKSSRYFFDQEAVREPASNTPGGRLTKASQGHQQSRRKGGARVAHGSGGLDKVGRCETRVPRTVWLIPTKPYKGSHNATFPEALVNPMVLAGSAPGDLVIDPFSGAATTGLAALRNGRRYIGIDLSREYTIEAQDRLYSQGLYPDRDRDRRISRSKCRRRH